MQRVLLDYSSVLIRPRVTSLKSRSQVSLKTHITKFLHSPREWKGVPIMVANMDTTGTFEVHEKAWKHGIITMLHKHYTVDQIKDFYSSSPKQSHRYIGISTGITDRDYEKLVELKKRDVDPYFITVDVANGYMEALTEYTLRIRKLFPDVILVAGNVVCGDRTLQLLVLGGVDIVKVGIGPGAACLTRQKTGVGIPQLSAVMDCMVAANKVDGMIVADGGITCPGDMAKAFCAGAHFVMGGSLFAGHYENPGEIIEEDGNKFKLFYGMSSSHAMKKHYGSKASYRSSEGRVVKVPLKGYIDETIEDYLGGLRSCCTYIDAKTIQEMSTKGEFVLVQNQLNMSLV